jgi:tungstate transport system ATP-binding protein
VNRALQRFGLERHANASAKRLSGGQIQLVALARAMILEPKVLLLDEPTAHLDPALVALIEDVISEIRSRSMTTLVWATHNLSQARRLADRVCFLLNGRIVETAPIEDFFRLPTDPRAAAFVQGRMVY